MKLRLVIDLDVPEFDGQSDAEVSQNLFDSYTHYVTKKHLEDAMRWCAKGRIGSDNEDATAKAIYNYHNTWADISMSANCKLEIL
jgi:hypothetical protein